MIGKISHGNSFGDCLDYLTRVKQATAGKAGMAHHRQRRCKAEHWRGWLAEYGGSRCEKADAHKVENQRSLRTYITWIFA